MLHKNTFFGIIAAIVYAQSALGVASMQTASDTTQGGTGGTLSRAGSLRTSATRSVSNTSKASTSSANEASSTRLASAVGGVSAIGVKSNKLTRSTAATGAALTELERKIDDLYVDIYDRRTVDAKLADKVDRGSDFNEQFDTRFGTKSVPTESMVTNLDTRLTTAEGKITTIESNPGTDENTVKSLIDSAVLEKGLATEGFVSSTVATAKTSAVDDAKGYADSKFALKSALDSKAEKSELNAYASKEDNALTLTTAKAYTDTKFTNIEIPDVTDLTGRVNTAEGKITALQTGLASKADAEDVYTKAEVNTKIAGISSGVGEEQVQQMISTAVNDTIGNNYYDKDHTYSQSEINSAITSAISSATNSANSYTDGKITGLATETFASQQAANALTAAENYADQKFVLKSVLADYDTSAQTTNKIQTATAGLATQTYASQQAASALSSAKDYADSKFATKDENEATLASAKAYADNKFIAASSGMSEEDVQEMIGTAVSSAIGDNYYTKTVADNKFATKAENEATLASAKDYADSKVVGLATETYASNQAADALAAAKTYADGKVTGLATETFASQQAANALSSAQSYADQKFVLKSVLADYDTSAQTTNKIQTATAGLATETFASQQAANALSSAEDYADQKFVLKSVLADYDTSAQTTEKIQTATAGLASETYADTKANTAFEDAKDYADEKFATKSALSSKADASVVSSLANDVETLQSGLQNVYTKAQVDETTAALRSEIVTASTGMDEGAVANMISAAIGDNYYTKTAADEKFATITTTDSLSSRITANTNALADKANASSVYTKTEVDTKLSGKLNSNALNSYSTTSQMNSAISSATANLASKSEVEELSRTVSSGLNDRPTTEQTLAMVNGAQLCAGTIRVTTVDSQDKVTYIVGCEE